MTTNFHDPDAVLFPADTVVLAPHELEGKLFAAPNWAAPRFPDC